MTFIEAISAAKEGKKISRPTFDFFLFQSLVGDLEYSRTNRHMLLESYLATDWEIVSEKKELSREDLAMAWGVIFHKDVGHRTFEDFCKELGL